MSSAISGSGGTHVDDTLAQFSSASAARQAYYSGSEGDGAADEDGTGEEGEEGEEGWTEWFRIDRVADWFVYGRESLEEAAVQFHITGTAAGDGRQVFLNKGGNVVDSMVIMQSMDEVNAALEAYFQREEDGEIPEEDRPNGRDPGPGQTPPGGGPGGGGGRLPFIGGGGGAGGGLPLVNRLPIVGQFGTIGQLIFVVLVVLAVYYYQGGETEEIPVVGGYLDAAGDRLKGATGSNGGSA